jgi:hypothetical protein
MVKERKKKDENCMGKGNTMDEDPEGAHHHSEIGDTLVLTNGKSQK